MANVAKKTEHVGSKKAKGAYWGRKYLAKSESNKKRRAENTLLIAEQLDQK